MTRPVHRPEDAKGGEPQVPKKRRSLSDGPAVRRALAQAESEAKSNAGWKLLETPLDSSHVSEVSGLLKTVDDTQPEPSWKVVAVVDQPMPPNTDDPAPTSKPSKAAPAQGTPLTHGNGPARRPTPARGTAITQGPSPIRRPTPAQGIAAPAGIPRPTGARPVGATIPALDAATRAQAAAPPTPALAATQKSVAPLASTAVIPRPTRRQTPPAVSLPVERTTPVPRPRSMMATQLGVAPPPAAPPPAPGRPNAAPAALAATELDAMPSTVRVDPALAATQLDAMPSTVRVERAFAQVTPNAPPPSHASAAFADTQLAAPRPPEVAALLDALDDDAATVVQVPEFMLEANPPAQTASGLPQAPLTTRSPDLATQTAATLPQVAAPISGSSEAPRAALSSEAFATTQDTVPPLPMSRPALRLPSPFDRWSRTQLIGLGCAALVAASLPLVAVGALLTSGTNVSPEPAAAAVSTGPPVAHATAAASVTTTARVANAPPVTSAAPPAPQASPKAAPQIPSAPQAPAIPWLDRPSVSTPSCDSLASARPGPKGFLLQQAIKQGQRELIRGNVKAAHTAFCEAVALGTPTDVVLIGLAQVLLMQSDANAALKTVEQLLTLRPNDRQALDLRGDIFIRLGRVDEARQTWYRAAGASRESASLIENLRRVNRADAARALKAGDLARADRLWRRVIALDVRDVAGCAELAAVLAKNGELDAARRWLAYADTLDPAHPRLVAVKSSLGG